jgi:glycolate oxidase iron-sulfur subunit
MRAVAGDLVPVDDAFEDMMSFCLQCRACEAACPSLVPFGRAMEGARTELAAQRNDSGRRLRHELLGRLVASPRLLRLGFESTRLARRTGAIQLIPAPLRSALAGMRPVTDQAPPMRGTVRPAHGEQIGAVALLAGCVMESWFAGVHEATVALLTRAGYRVVVPAQQTCCGALAAHDGDARRARRLAGRNVRALQGVDLVVSDAAGCSAHLKEYGEWAGDAGAILAGRARDITEVIATAIDDGLLPKLPVDRGVVAVQDPCHLRHAQRIFDAPRVIVSAAGYQPVDLADDQCCGAAGLYSMLNPETSHQLGENKAAQIRRVGSTVVASANPGCEMQLRAHLETWYRVAHPVELYWEAIREEELRSLENPE